MKTDRLLVLLGGALVTLPLYAQDAVDCSRTLPPKQNVICLKQDYESTIKNHPDMVKNSRELIKEGDIQFQRKNYQKAYKAYFYATFNLPNAYSYLRSGEVTFQGLAREKAFRDDNAKSTGACLLPSKFVWTVDQTVTKEYQTGIELYKILKAGPPVSDAMLADAQQKSRCLTALADQYRQVKTGCVDLAKVRACMGIL